MWRPSSDISTARAPIPLSASESGSEIGTAPFRFAVTLFNRQTAIGLRTAARTAAAEIGNTRRHSRFAAQPLSSATEQPRATTSAFQSRRGRRPIACQRRLGFFSRQRRRQLRDAWIEIGGQPLQFGLADQHRRQDVGGGLPWNGWRPVSIS